MDKYEILKQYLGDDSFDESDYEVYTDKEATERAKELILDSLWAFRASFILSHSKIDMDEKYFTKIQGDLCEGANGLVKSMIDDIDYFVEDAINCDGRGHFISTYDGEENEIKIDGEYYYIYRTN